MPFRQQHTDATIEAAAERRRAGASLRDLEEETGIPRSTLSRRISAYEAERLTAVPLATDSRPGFGGRPEDSDRTSVAPIAATVPSLPTEPRTYRPFVWEDERFPGGVAFAFDRDHAREVFRQPGWGWHTDQGAQEGIGLLASAGHLYRTDAEIREGRNETRVPASAAPGGNSVRALVVPGVSTAREVSSCSRGNVTVSVGGCTDSGIPPPSELAAYPVRPAPRMEASRT